MGRRLSVGRIFPSACRLVLPACPAVVMVALAGDTQWSSQFAPADFNAAVTALERYGSGKLYAGGDLTTAGGVAATTSPGGTAPLAGHAQGLSKPLQA